MQGTVGKMGVVENFKAGKMRVGKMGVRKMGQFIGKTKVDLMEVDKKEMDYDGNKTKFRSAVILPLPLIQ